MTSNNSHVQHPPECDSLSALLENPGRVSTVPAHIVPLFIAEEAAHSLGVTKRWVQRRARRLPFARQLSEHAIRYSEAGLRRWMANRHVHAA